MDVLTPVVVGGLLALFTGVQVWLNKGRFDVIDRRFDAIDRRFDTVDRRFDAADRRFEQLAADVASLRSDLTHVALAVGARTRPQTG